MVVGAHISSLRSWPKVCVARLEADGAVRDPGGNSLDFKSARGIETIVSCIAGLVRERAAEGEARLKQALGGLLIGGFVRAYLPQTGMILTEQENVTIQADP